MGSFLLDSLLKQKSSFLNNMAGRPKIIRTPEEWKQIHKERRKKYRTYNLLYQKNNYLKKKLADPNYNKKNYQKKKLKKEQELNKDKEQNKELEQ